MKISDVIDLIESAAPLSAQEDWDNSGLQLGDREAECTGALLCVDATPEIVAEAKELGYNLVITHHPLLFNGLKAITGDTRVQRTVIDAIRGGVAIYSAHTSIDNAPDGVSWEMAKRLGVEAETPLTPTGTGIAGRFAEPITGIELVERVKSAFGSPVARVSSYPLDRKITRVAMCGGAGASLLPQALASGAEAYVTSDTSYHHFVDLADRLLIIDIGHWESESLVKSLFYHLITEKIPNFAVRCSSREQNPINYI